MLEAGGCQRGPVDANTRYQGARREIHPLPPGCVQVHNLRSRKLHLSRHRIAADDTAAVKAMLSTGSSSDDE